MRQMGLPWTDDEGKQKRPYPSNIINVINQTATPKRGRPKRSSVDQQDLNGDTPRKRGPGRPRRSLEASLIEDGKSIPVSRGPGRPPKEVVKKRPGRPRKTL